MTSGQHRRAEADAARVGLGERHDVGHLDGDGGRLDAGLRGLGGRGLLELTLQLRADAAERLRGDRARGRRGQHLRLRAEDDRAVDLAALDRGDRGIPVVDRGDLERRRARARRCRRASWSSWADGPAAAIGRSFASEVMAGQRNASTITETAVASTTAIATTRAHGVGPADGLWSDMASLSVHKTNVRSL